MVHAPLLIGTEVIASKVVRTGFMRYDDPLRTG